MSFKSKPKSLGDHLSRVRPVTNPPDGYISSYYIAAEVQSLEREIVALGSPGAKMLVRKMSAFDLALGELYKSLANFTPQDYHKYYTADRRARRYVRQKSNMNLSVLGYIIEQMHVRLSEFDITPENSDSLAISEGLQAALEWRHNYIREKAREARQQRVTPQKAVSRSGTKRSTARGPARSPLKVKTGIKS